MISSEASRTAGPALSAPSLDDPRLVAALEEYLAAVEAGQTPDRAEFLARHADLDGALAQCLDGLNALQPPPSAASMAGGSVGPSLQAELPVGDFLIKRELGRGGMGIVYEAEQLSLGRKVALKVLPFASTLDPRKLQRFQNEARAAGCLQHAHIVPVYAVGCERGVHYYAMQFVEGQSLAPVLDELREQAKSASPRLASPAAPAAGDALTPPVRETQREPRGQASTLPGQNAGKAYYRRVAELMIEAAEALEHAHEAGIIHRDVKPANLLLDERGKLWVADFGLAQIQSDARLTMTGDLVGTLRYMSPEQALAKRVVIDHRTDIYSLGATLYELLTLRPVFEGVDRQELLRQIAFEDPKPARRLNRAIPVEMETIAAKALEKNPADRYGSMRELANDLKRFLKDEPITARRAGLVQRARKWSQRHRPVVWATAATLMMTLAMAAGGGGWMLRDRALREAETERAVNAALKEADEMQAARKIPEALAKVKQAAAILASGAGTDKVHQQVQARRADLQFAADLEDLRARRAAQMVFLKDAYNFDYPGADRRYGERFRAFGVDIDAMTIEDANRRFAASSVRLEIAAGVDDWCFVVRKARPKEPELWKRLLVVAKATDPDRLRNQVRDVLAEDKVDGLKSLAAAITGEALSAGTAVVVGFALIENKANDEAVALLTKAQWRHHGDFWVNFALARALGDRAKGNDRAEAIGFYRAAIALRPESSVAWHNLGAQLKRTQRREEAIIAFREAIRLYPQNEWTREGLGEVFAELKQWDAAIGEYQQVGKADVKAAMRASRRITHVFAVSGQLQAALESAEELRRLNPAEACYCIGQIRERLRDVHGAIEAYKQTVSFSSEIPDEARSLERLAWLLPPGEALEFAVAAVGKNPQKNTYNALGIAQYRNQNWDGCINAMQKAAELREAAKASHLFFLAMAHYQRGENTLACSLYQKAVVWMEDNPFRDDDYALRGYRAEAAELLGIPLRKEDGKEAPGAKQ